MRITFDIETNMGDFRDLEGFTEIHCMSYSIDNNPKVHRLVGPSAVRGFWTRVADRVIKDDYRFTFVGHNIINFDIPALRQILGPELEDFFWDYLMVPHKDDRITIHDTKLMCQLGYPDIWASSQKNPRWRAMEPKYHSRHSLAAWGQRVGKLKGSIGDGAAEETWDHYTESMGNYCDQDVAVTRAVYEYLRNNSHTEWLFSGVGQEVIKREARFAQLIQIQQRAGCSFDEELAEDVSRKIYLRTEEIREELSKVFPPEVITTKTPLYWEAKDTSGKYLFKAETKGGLEAIRKKRKLMPKEVTYTKGPMKTKEIPFNPGSRQQIVGVLKERYGWEPMEFTEPSDSHPDGQPKVDGETLSSLEWPEAKLLSEYLELTKVGSYVSGTDNSWSANSKNGRLHGGVDTLGCNTSRCAHSKPNLGQVPSGRKLFGAECRSMFRATPGTGRKYVGCDASGLEARAFAGYLAYFDRGRYAKIILEGDVHSSNQEAAGLATRDQAKTFFYGFLFGAGAKKLGSIAGKGPKAGAMLKQKFLSKTPGLERLIQLIERNYQKNGFLKGLDGRKMYPRSEHSALNLILQGAGAIIMKEALIQFYFLLDDQGIKLNENYWLLINCHDEYQCEVQEDYVEAVAKAGPEAITKAGEVLGLACRLDGEAKVGDSWKDTH
jgi:DNA polymerase I